MKNAGQILKAIMVKLGMEVKLEQMKLADGVTIIEADSFDGGMNVSIATEDGQMIPLPIGEYELEDGRILMVTVEGVIDSIGEKQAEEVEEVEAESEAPATVEAPAQTQPKSIIESTSKEYKFSMEEMEAKIVELEAKIVELTKVEEVVELEAEPKPIVFNPENETQVEKITWGNNAQESKLDKIFKMINEG